MNPHLVVSRPKGAIPIYLLTAKTYKEWLAKQSATVKAWLAESSFKADKHTFVRVPSPNGGAQCILSGITATPNLWSIAHLPAALGKGTYYLHDTLSAEQAEHYCIGWQLACYQFDSYKKNVRTYAKLSVPANVDIKRVTAICEATYLARNLINTPASDMTPVQLAKTAQSLARAHKATCSVISGNQLLKQNYPMVHAVGRASANAPCLIDLKWGNIKHPKLTLVGKGVCFDSGGLDLKSAGNMKLMKKDMGGAAAALALALIIMQQKLPVRLRVLIPAVENSVSANAFRPMDIIKTRKGLTVEIGNTDAEGRLILCDALAEADKEKPDLMIDFATLTGAARTALGTDIPALFSNDEALASMLQATALAEHDPLWRLPLWEGYRELLNSPIADLNNAPDSPYAGAITAALFLREFVRNTTPWAHIDMMAWNTQNRPGRPAGGEAMAVRALFAFLSKRYRKK